MKIGILGSGEVGQILGLGFARRCHQVSIGSRTPGSGKLNAWAKKSGPTAKAGTFAEAAQGEVLVLACHGTAVDEVIRAAGPTRRTGKLDPICILPLHCRGPAPN